MTTVQPQAPAGSVVEDLYDEDGNYSPVPGTEYPFAVSDLARAVRALLGKGWTAESGHWGTTGTLTGPYTASFTFQIDYEGDLCVEYDLLVCDAWPESPSLPDDFRDWDHGVYLALACSADGLDRLAEQHADAIRAITGYDPADYDFESPASRQHFTAHGRYLRVGEAEQV
ncbi:hypothetical protein ABZ804_21825 [Streptomyces sp. NPDC047726]|uniref:hypothetical protein n=1 Tax=unclassified Streptomyces TaxID=2593676 RepID=UPI0033FC0CF0